MKQILAAAAFFAAAPALAATCSGQSPAHTVALVELYTSEGCSDCPPADRWLRSLRAAGLPAGSLAPVALHVDYWDAIGWKDPFASATYSARQRELAAVQGKTFVYTPQVMLAGRDYRRWTSAASFTSDVKAVNAQPARASIGITLQTAAGGRVEARARAQLARPSPDAALYFALTEDGLSNDVKAGENRGARLEHDHVARQWAKPVTVPAGGPAESTLVGRRAAGGALAFVQDRRSGEVLQAYFLPYCPG